jgi:hypothetical protein
LVLGFFFFFILGAAGGGGGGGANPLMLCNMSPESWPAVAWPALYDV